MENKDFLDSMAELVDSKTAKYVYSMQYANKSTHEDNADLEALLRANGLYSKEYIDSHLYTGYERFGIGEYIDPYNSTHFTREYVFFTKPDLNILGNPESGGLYSKNNGNDTYLGLNIALRDFPFFTDAYERYLNVLEDLCQSHSISNKPLKPNQANGSKIYRDFNMQNNFIPLLSNTMMNELELPNLSADMTDSNANVYGDKISYRNSSKGYLDHNFSIEFKDTRYSEVYMFFRIFDEYITLKNLGLVSPRSNHIWRKILADQISIYKIIVDEDGSSIIHYSKFTGVSPLDVPMSSFSNMNGFGDDKGKLTVSFKATFVEDMNPYILAEFNSVVASPVGGFKNLMKNYKEAPLYDVEHLHADGSWPKYPYIYWDNTTTGIKKYYLRWKSSEPIT